jgi:hypothetical protein
LSSKDISVDEPDELGRPLSSEEELVGCSEDMTGEPLWGGDLMLGLSEAIVTLGEAVVPRVCFKSLV